MLERGREFAFSQEPDRLEAGRGESRPNMPTRLSQDERKAVAQRIFAALCAQYPKHYVALIESEVAAGSPEQVVSAAAVQAPDDSIG